MVELTDVEKLIVKQAIFNAIADDVKTKEPSNLRGRLDEAMKESYYGNPMAGKSYDLRLLGQKVGTYSLTVSKGKPQEVRRSFEVRDVEKFKAWAQENGFMAIDMKAVESHFAATGEVPEGCAGTEVIVPEVVGGVVTRTTVKVDQAEVGRVLGPQIQPIVYALLERGE